MIYIAVALYQEGVNIINHYNLKRVSFPFKTQVFKNDRITLLITGVGYLNSSIALTNYLSYNEVDKSDLFINFGCCGSSKTSLSKGELFLCNKVVDNISKRSFYPDILLESKLLEGRLTTFPHLVDTPLDYPTLVDLEGAALYQGASFFLPPSRIFILKVVSDYLSPGTLSPSEVIEIINNVSDKLFHFLDTLMEDPFNDQPKISFNEDEKTILDRITSNLRLTKSMELSLYELSRYYKLRGLSLLDVLSPYKDNMSKNKNMGRELFNEIKEKLMAI